MSDVDPKTTETETTATEPQAASPFTELPIAARIPCDPGWRAVVLEPGETDKLLRIVILPLEHWALDAPMIDMRKTGHTDLRLVFSLAGSGTFNTMLWPIDPNTKKRVPVERLYALIPPCETTSEALLEEVTALLREEEKEESGQKAPSS